MVDHCFGSDGMLRPTVQPALMEATPSMLCSQVITLSHSFYNPVKGSWDIAYDEVRVEVEDSYHWL